MSDEKTVELHSFEYRYRKACEQVCSTAPHFHSIGVCPTLTEMKEIISEAVEDADEPFKDFEDFHSWWEAATAYDQPVDGEELVNYRPLYFVAYQALVSEGVL